MDTPSPADLRRFPEELRGKFEPIETLGAGGMGEVYRARDLALDRVVALKLMHSQLGGSHLERFHREAGALARVRHPNLVQVFEHGKTRAGPYLVMELLEGVPLDEGPPGDDLHQVMLEVGAGLEALHDAGLVHRDLKPQNILRTLDGRVVIVDLGLAFDPERTRLTREGRMVGTLAYMPPEAFTGATPDPAFDWYAWGMTYFYLKQGRYPFPPVLLLEMLHEGTFPELELGKGIDPTSPLAELFRAVLSRHPEERPTCVDEVQAILETVSSPDHPAPDIATTGPEDPTYELGNAPAPAPPGPVAPPSTGPFAVPTTGALAPISTTVSATRDLILDRPRTASGLVLAFLLVGFLLVGDRGPDPGPAPLISHPDPSAPRGPRPPDFSRARERLARQLATAERVRLDLTGRPLEDGATPAGETFSLLDTDPARWDHVIRNLPDLRAFHDWLREGGRPEDLSPEVREELLLADGLFELRGLVPPPFADFLEVAPATEPSPLPEFFRGSAFASVDLPDPLPPGWAGTAAREFAHAVAFARARDQDFQLGIRTDSRPPGFPEEPWRRRREWLTRSLFEFVRASSAYPAIRRGFRGYLAEGTSSLIRAYRAAGCALATGGEDAELAVQLIATPSSGQHPMLYYSAFVMTPVRSLLAGEHEDPRDGWLAGNTWFFQRVVRRRMGLPEREGDLEREIAALERALGDLDPEVSPEAAQRHAQALVARVDLERHRGRVPGILDQISRMRHLSPAAPSWVHPHLLGFLKEIAGNEDQAHPIERERARELLRGLTRRDPGDP